MNNNNNSKPADRRLRLQTDFPKLLPVEKEDKFDGIDISALILFMQAHVGEAEIFNLLLRGGLPPSIIENANSAFETLDFEHARGTLNFSTAAIPLSLHPSHEDYGKGVYTGMYVDNTSVVGRPFTFTSAQLNAEWDLFNARWRAPDLEALFQIEREQRPTAREARGPWRPPPHTLPARSPPPSHPSQGGPKRGGGRGLKVAPNPEISQNRLFDRNRNTPPPILVTTGNLNGM